MSLPHILAAIGEGVSEVVNAFSALAFIIFLFCFFNL